MPILTSEFIGSWYLLGTSLTNVPGTSYVLANSISNSSDYTTNAKELVQGEAGTLVIDQLGLKEKCIVTADALIINPLPDTVMQYYDIIDQLLSDYYLLLNFLFISVEDVNNTGDLDWFNAILSALGLTLENKNLLSSATINIGQSINCSLHYNTRYDRKYTVQYNNLPDIYQPYYDFIARTAKNYDCRFYIDGNEYSIKSGTLNINIGYSEIYIANTKSQLPFYSPQSHSVTGSIEILAPHNTYRTIPVEGNCSLLVGDRYIELGQASIKSSYNRKIEAGQSASTITINFTAYARLGAGITNARWTTYYLNQLDTGKLINIYNILQSFLVLDKTADQELIATLDYVRGLLP